MNFNKNIFIIGIMVIMLSACSNEPVESQTDANSGKTENVKAKDTDGNVLDGYKKQVQKAKDMEQVVLDQAEKRKKQSDGNN